MKYSTQFLLVIAISLFLFSAPETCAATTNMPWEEILRIIAESFKSPVARAILTISGAVAVFIFALGDFRRGAAQVIAVIVAAFIIAGIAGILNSAGIDSSLF